MLDTKLQSEEFKFYFFFFLALTFLFSMLMPFSYGDLAVWIAEGHQILRQGTLYIQDAHSFNPTQVSPYPWLSCLIYYSLDSLVGIQSIFFLHRLIPVFIVSFWLLQYPNLLEKRNWFILVICISGISMLIVDRPALLALPLVLYTYQLMDSGKVFTNKIKSLLLLVFWTNLHGSFPIFLILLGFKIFTERKKVLGFLPYCLLATFINPWGYKIYHYVIHTATLSKVRMTEWQPLSFNAENAVFFESLFFCATVAILVAISLKRKKLIQLFKAPVVFFLITSITAVRNLALFFLTLPIHWGKHLTDQTPLKKDILPVSNSKIWLNRSITLSVVAAGLFVFSGYSKNFRRELPKKYQNAYDYTSCFEISKHLSSTGSGKRIFNAWVLGSFLMLNQDHKIFIDTRNIIYGNVLFNDYLKIMNNHENAAEVLLNQYQISFVVSEKIKPVTLALQASQNWTFIMEDNGYALFERK